MTRNREAATELELLNYISLRGRYRTEDVIERREREREEMVLEQKRDGRSTRYDSRGVLTLLEAGRTCRGGRNDYARRQFLG